MQSETLSFNTAGGPSTAYAALPEAGSTRAVIVVQEWWGLNDHIKDIAGRWAAEGFIAIAPDLYRGRIAADAEEASKMMHALDAADGIDTIKNALSAAAERFGISRFGITGYCMGGTFTLLAACTVDGLNAAAAFYGDIPEDDVLSRLSVPTMFISGTRDGWITPEKVAGLETAADEHELPVTSVKYDADHAFFNNTRPEVYDADSARDAWAKVVAFFDENL